MQTYRWQTLITFKSKISLCSLVTPERLAQWAKLLKHLICVLIYVFGFCSWYKPNQEISQILPEQVQSREKFFLILLMFVSVLTLKLFVSALTLKLWAIVETVMCLNIFFWARKLTKDKNSALITFFFYLIAIAFRMPQLKHVEKQVTIILSLLFHHFCLYWELFSRPFETAGIVCSVLSTRCMSHWVEIFLILTD